MPDPEDLQRLAERVEVLSGPDREVDVEIAPITGLRVVDEGHPLGRCCYDRNGRLVVLPRFTASLDAAMSLVPEGAHFGLGHDASGPMLGWAWVRARTEDGWRELHSPPRIGFRHVAPWPQSPALALTAASLRARIGGAG